MNDEIVNDKRIENGMLEAAASSVCDSKSQIADSREDQGVFGPTGVRRNGKVARLPKATREKINQLLDDGVEYDAIIEQLGAEGKGLLKQNISRWAQGGYRDWVKEQERKVLLSGNFEKIVDTMAKAEPEEIPDLVTKLLAARMGGVLSEITPQDLRENSEKHPQTLVRLLALVPKLSREALRTRKYRRAVQKEDAAELKQRDPNKPFGDEDDHRAVVGIVDKVLGIDRYRKLMMEQHAAEKAARAAQPQSPASGDVTPAISADGAPLSLTPGFSQVPEQPPEEQTV